MAIIWDWNDKIGTMEYEYNTGEGRKRFKYDMYGGNCLYIVVDNYEKNGEKYYSLVNFAADEHHLKNMLGLNKKQGYEGIDWSDLKKVTLLIDNRKSRKTAELFIKAGIPITIEMVKEV